MACGYIYALTDPETDDIRYVGKTARDPHRRLWEHNDRSGVSNNRKGKLTKVNEWIESLEDGPGLLVLEEHPSSLEESEARWIHWLRADGLKLLNMTDGGDGDRKHGTQRTKKKPRFY